MSAKSLSLVAGALQQACLVLIIRYSKIKTQHRDENAEEIQYLTSVAVACSELFKLGLSFFLEIITSDQAQPSPPSSPPATESYSAFKRYHLKVKAWSQKFALMINVFNRESLKLLIPAALYLTQNNLLFVALSHLSVPLYQVTNQGKLLTTALISRILLKKHISALQYCAITILGLGVAVIHLSEYYGGTSGSTSGNDDDGGEVTEMSREQNQLWGLCAVLLSCLTSGFSGVYFELLLKTQSPAVKKKQQSQSLHFKNFQLALWSLILAMGLIFYKDHAKIQQHGLFQGFDAIVIVVIVSQGLTGFVVSLMLKYADAVLKGFAVAVAAVLSTFASVVLFGTKINIWFAVGASMVVLAIRLYSYKPKPSPSAAKTVTLPSDEESDQTEKLLNKRRKDLDAAHEQP